jgi:hypothetical protein
VGKDEVVETEAPASPDWNQFIEGINRLNANVEGLRGDVQPRDPPPEDKPAPKREALPEKPLDEMTNAELAKFIRESTANDIVDKIQPLLAQFGTKQAEQEQAQLTESYTREIESLSGKHKDFGDWNSEMIAIVEETPGITPLRAYHLARSENPEKVKKLEEKYAPPKAPLAPKPFSMSPYGSNEPDAPKPHANKEAAFKAALAKVNAKWPGVLTGQS